MQVHAARLWLIRLLLCASAIAASSSCEDAGEDLRPPPFLGYREDEEARYEKLVSSDAWSRAEPARNNQGLLVAVHERTGMTFVLIPSGRFQMGSPKGVSGSWKRESPVHSVEVKAFLLCGTECTQQAWEKGGGSNRSEFQGPLRPVEQVSWAVARAWCDQVGLRLPSEAEWEYSCRAGTRTQYSFGHNESDLLRHGWLFLNSGDHALPADTEWSFQKPYRDWACKTHDVRQKLPNPWGLFDVHGNVGEWCEDTWHNDYSGAPGDGSAWTAGDAIHHVCRGGSWDCSARLCRSANRSWGFSRFSSHNTGLRPAADLPALEQPDGD